VTLNSSSKLAGHATSRIALLDLHAAYLELKEEYDAAYGRVMQSGWYILGEELEKFEAEFAAFCRARHCIVVANGLEALLLILRGYGIGPGDEVIVPSNTFIATWLAVTHAGATPVPVDPSPDTFNLDPSLVESALTPRTRAIIAVHLYGQLASMDELSDIAVRRHLRLIEDAAQAHGAAWNGHPTGSLGHAAAFSFYPAKNLGAFGDGGAIVTSDPALFERLRRLRNYGSAEKFHHEFCGYNSRLDPLQAAFLRVRLGHLEEWNSRRRQIAAIYREGLAGLSRCILPAVPTPAVPVWHQFVIRHPERDQLRRYLASLGIETGLHYPMPPHLSDAYSGLGIRRGALPIAEQLAATVLSLPMGPHLPAAGARRVVGAIRDFEATRA